MSVKNSNMLVMKLIVFILLSFLMSGDLASLAVLDKVEGFQYDLKRIENPPLHKSIKKEFDLYELYFDNKSDKTFSIPGYSIDLGIDYSTFSEIQALFKAKSNKKFAIFNIAANAASFALGGIPRLAANAVVSSFRTLRNRNTGFGVSSDFLSAKDTYLFYPGDSLSLLLFLAKDLAQAPAAIRFICRDEENNTNIIVVDKNIKLEIINVEDEKDAN